ncbi:MAG TPA: alpha-N-acetylglucosaminidase [Verrucomicrobiae bacterium]
MIKIRCAKILLLAAFVGISQQWAEAGTESAARGLIARMIPQQAKLFIVETIPADDGRDVFEIESRAGKIVLRGNNGVAIASALKRYLADFCHADPGWMCGSQMALPKTLPTVPEKIRVISPYQFRFEYNYCTHGYTFAWWDWPRWERELDDLALHGVNLALIIEGQEQVWINALKEFGYTDAEVRQWLVMPSHQPWQFMSNMENYGGPVPASLVKRRLELGKKIIARMRELGIEPVQQGYYGIVPSDFKKRFPAANVHAQGDWSVLKRPDMLDPADSLFAKFAAAFYHSQKQFFGDAKFLAADPFHEGGKTDGIDLPACARKMFAPMSNAYPNVTWVFQSWQANPRQQMLDALDKTKCLVLDLYCEDHENWRERNQFGGTPWLWCSIHNFGGNNFIASKLADMAEGPAKALAEAGPGRGFMRGIGGLMEGSDTHPAVWEMLFAQTWRTNAPDFNVWLDGYVRCRYGADDASARLAVQTLFDSAWNVGPKMVHYNSVICGRPSLDTNQTANPYCGTTPPYDETKVVAAWKQLLAAAPACGASDGYRYDVADVGRQVLADLGTHYHKAIIRAFMAKDVAQLRLLSGKMLGLLRDMDELAGTRREFLLGAWLADARAWGKTPAEKDLCEWNARTLLTTWTVPQSHIDYANRQWNGLLGEYYFHRWQMWLDALNAAVGQTEKFNQDSVRKKIQDWEYAWTHEIKKFPAQPIGDTVTLAKKLLAKYEADAGQMRGDGQ